MRRCPARPSMIFCHSATIRRVYHPRVRKKMKMKRKKIMMLHPVVEQKKKKRGDDAKSGGRGERGEVGAAAAESCAEQIGGDNYVWG